MKTQDLEQVEQYAGHFFSPEQIACIMGLEKQWALDEMAKDGESEFRTAVLKGRLMSEAEVRKSIFELAKSGSGPAQLLAHQIIEKSQLNQIPI